MALNFLGMKKEDEHPWIKLKRYPHIGFPLKHTDFSFLESYITNQEKIKSHSFLPFIQRTLFQRRYRAIENGERSEKSKKRKREKKIKPREILFASHFDAQIFSYYSHILTDKYNELLKKKSFNDAVVAYRKIPLHKGSERNKCNVDFALDAFSFIKKNEDQQLTVIVSDITNFFNSLDHKILKRQWIKVWNAKSRSLPKDHYNVFKALTRVRYVNEDVLFQKYKDRIWIKTGSPNEPKNYIHRQKSIKYKRFLKENNAIAYCETKEFYKNGLPLIDCRNDTKGIPQGTALSATLANIYMLDFDQKMQEYIDSIGGFYQRYSDDIILVFPRNKQKATLAKIKNLIVQEVKLEIHSDKTKVYHFEKENGDFKGVEVDEATNKRKNGTLEYLGFEYNGKRVLLKTAGLSKFYRSMKTTFKKKASLAKYAGSTEEKLYKGSLYKRFTYRGANRRMHHGQKKVTYSYSRSNYQTYIHKANAAFYEFNGNRNLIKRQSRNFWNNFHILMKYHEREINKKKVKV